jgi:thymidine kinase
MTAGRLIVICGPMFSGKTTELIRRARQARADGETVAVFTPRTDTRSGDGRVRSHDRDHLEAIALDDPKRIHGAARESTFIVVDEAHFFGGCLAAEVLALVSRGLTVVVAGLERDHRGRPFDPLPALLCEADEVIKRTTPCARCGAPAIHSQRLIASSERIVVGGAESYEPRCRSCFVPGI